MIFVELSRAHVAALVYAAAAVMSTLIAWVYWHKVGATSLKTRDNKIAGVVFALISVLTLVLAVLVLLGVPKPQT